MGLFKKKSTCTVCNQNAGAKDLLDGIVCKECIDKCYPFLVMLNYKNVSTQKVKDAMSAARQNEERTKIFNPSKKIDKYFEVDEQNKMWKTYSSSIIFTYDEIADYELIENGESFTKGSLSGAIVGGALFGGVGAIVGSSMKAKTKQEISQYMIKIITKNPFAQETIINFLTTGKVKSDSFLYKSYSNAAQSILSQLTIITNCAIAAENSVQNSSADEILKFKQLFDAGVITQEEFDAKKRQLLGL